MEQRYKWTGNKSVKHDTIAYANVLYVLRNADKIESEGIVLTTQMEDLYADGDVDVY